MTDQFDPTKHTVAEVNEYLATASAEERDRVLALEVASATPRASLVGKEDAKVEEADDAPIAAPQTQGEIEEAKQGDPEPDGEPVEEIGAPQPDSRARTTGGVTPDRVAPPTAAVDDDMPEWDVRTHGKPNTRQRMMYRVIGE